jgi:alkanesulfonate monooxygenase SsuD/methylene tetrahydromethanopterin reductase-like flavin-dependent oxidoreductase (luciferase family)
MAVEFGVLIPTREAVMSGHNETAPLLTMAERAEAAGFDSVWIGDSLIARPRHEPLTLMAAIAGRTRRVRLGTGVLLPALRNPVVLAHIVGTLDRAAEGRVILGMGFAADNPPIRKEFAAAGVPFERRIGRFLETIEICQALWRRDHVSFQGKHFTLDDVTMEPKPHRPGGPPIWIGGSGPTALRIAARYDAWFPTGPSVEFFAEHFPGVQNAARAAGRPADAVAGAAYVTLALDANRAAAEQRLNTFLETYYAAPARTILARQAAAPALDRRRRASLHAALRRRRSARAGGRDRVEALAAAQALASSTSALIAIVPSGVTAQSSQPFAVGRPRSSNGAVSNSGARAWVV